MGVKSIFFEKGQVVGHLTFIKEAGSWVFKCKVERFVLCRCKCGKKVTIRASMLYGKGVPSCGCMRYSISYVKTHGLTNKHPLYGVWKGMKARCYNKNTRSYHRYGGRGVKVCKKWADSFKAFYNWAIKNGWEKGLQLDKDIKGNGLLYSPKNCCFVTHTENQNATSKTLYVELNGENIPFRIACKKLKVNPGLTYQRMKYFGYTFNQAVLKKSHIRLMV
jgi:hypothetical protein